MIRAALTCIVLPAVVLAQPAPNVKASLDALDKARANLAAAVKKIQVDPPSNEDLDAAHASVAQLKEVIDQGAANEAADLDYARAALAARKDLRTQRDFVDERRSKVKIFEKRRTLDEALANMKAKAAPIEGKEPTQTQFDEARAAVKAVQKEIADSKQYTSQDQKFAAYLTELDGTASKQLAAIDQRLIALNGDKQRGVLDASRQNLTAAIAPLSKDSTDEQFSAADKALSELNKKLEEGRPFEADKTYRGSADKGRSESATARKKIDELFGQTGLARLKAQIEPSNKDMIAAGRQIRVRKPAPEQLAEARTASLVVRGLIEKFSPQAERSPEFATYLAGVRSTLDDVEGQVELRTLDAAKSDVLKAMRPVENINPKDEHFEEAIAAVNVLEKTLATVHPKNAVIAAPAADAKQLIRDSKATITRRRTEVDVEQQKAKVEEARGIATGQMDKLIPQTLSKEQIDDAERGWKLVAATLDAGKGLPERSRDYAAYDREVRKRVTEGFNKIERNRVVLAGNDGRALVTELLAAAKLKLDEGRRPEATDADVDVAVKGVDAVEQALTSRAELETKNAQWAAFAQRSRGTQIKLIETQELMKQSRDVRKKTGEALTAGNAIAATATQGSLRAQKTQHEKALALFKNCKEEGPALVSMNPLLTSLVVIADGQRRNPGDVIAECGKRAEAMKAAIKPIDALVSFDEGPKRAYELATKLLGQGKKKEALAQFDECTATAMTVQYRNVDLREKTFEVGGQGMTLQELIKKCSAQSKALLGK